mmetsp:Transcript_16110/g.23706  ORF Transcript_16110/g.23706 Transcript_16110/m.23706 type:complete len:116 (-) Transcript_16110:147-494(-)
MQQDEKEIPLLDKPSETERNDTSSFMGGFQSECVPFFDTRSKHVDGCTSFFVDGFQSAFVSSFLFEAIPVKQNTQQRDMHRIQQKQTQQRKMVQELRQRIDQVEERRALRKGYET